MSIPEKQEILLSQLVDHELPADQANQLLGGLLDELGDALNKSEACVKLRSMLKLQAAFSSWRLQSPSKQTVIVPLMPSSHAASASPWRFARLATAVLLCGILVTGAFFLGGRLGETRHETSLAVNVAGNAAHQLNVHASQAVSVVTPEQRREIARAFALHESVAGPLNWYAADDSTIQVAHAEKNENLQQPVALVLRLSPDSSSKETKAKTFVIVCRDNDSATIKLPKALFTSDVRLRLMSKATDKGVSLQYVVMADDSGSEWNDAALVGRRKLDLSQTSLGQLALNDRLVNVDASAWIMRDK